MLLGLARAALLAALAAAAAAEPEPGGGAAPAAVAAAAPAAAGAHAALRLAEADRQELEAGTSTLLELIDGPRAGSRYRCTITGRGELPDTYNVKVLLSPPQELSNVPAELLQRPSEASSFILRPKPIPAFVGSEDREVSEQEEEGQRSEEGEPEEEASGDHGEEPGAQSYLDLKGSRARLKEGPAEEDLEKAPAEVEEGAAPKEASKEAMEEKQKQELAAIRRMLGHTPAPLPVQSPVDNPSHAIKELRQRMVDDRHRRAAAAAQRREETKHRMQALTSERKKLLSSDSARQAALRAQRKAYWQTPKDKVHITVRDWNGTQLEFSVRSSMGLRPLMVTSIVRLGLEWVQVEFLKNGTRLTPFQTLASAGLCDHDVLDVEPKDPRLRQAARALARRAAERRPAPAQAPAPAARAQAPAAGQAQAAPEIARRPAAQAFEAEVYKKKQPKRGGGAKNPDMEYEVGDFMEMRIEHTVRRLNSGPDEGGSPGQGGNWIPCTITGKGSKPNTYKVHFPLAPSQQGDIEDVPAIGLRMVQAQDWAQKIKRLRQDPAAAQEAMAQAAREAEKRRRLKALTNKVKGTVATPQTAEQAAQKPPAPKPPVPTAVRRPMAPGAQHGILPASALGEKRPALSRH